MSSTFKYFVKTAILSVALLGVQACGGGESESSSKTVKVEKAKSSSKVKLDPKNTDTLLTSFNEMLAEQTEDNRFKITTIVMMLSNGQEPGSGTVYLHTRTAAYLQPAIGTPQADIKLRGTFSKASSQYASLLKGKSDADLINMFNEDEAIAIKVRKERLKAAIAAHEKQIDIVQVQEKKTRSEIAELGKNSLGPDDGFISNVTVVKSENRGKDILNLGLRADYTNVDSQRLGATSRVRVRVWLKDYPGYVMYHESSARPIGVVGTDGRPLKEIAPGQTLPISLGFGSKYAGDLIGKIRAEKQREPMAEDFEAEGRLESVERYRLDLPTRTKTFRPDFDIAAVSEVRKKMSKARSCANTSTLKTTLNGYKDLLEKFETDPSPRGNYSAIKSYDTADAFGSACGG